jgi:hypothetical protein
MLQSPPKYLFSIEIEISATVLLEEDFLLSEKTVLEKYGNWKMAKKIYSANLSFFDHPYIN